MSEKKCEDCKKRHGKHCLDKSGMIIGHYSLVRYMRSTGNCGPDAKLFEPKKK